MKNQKYVEDLSQIKEVMHRASRSVALTGLSPIAAGIVGTAGALIAYQLFFTRYGGMGYEKLIMSNQDFSLLNLIVWPTLMLGLGLGLFFALSEIRKRRRVIWNEHINQLFVNLAIPLLTGGVVCLILFFNGYIGMVISLSLVFYGLALLNTNKYTIEDIRTLGLLEILLGLLAMYLPNYGIIFWGLGFGLLHIIYGLNMQVKGDS